MTPRLRPYADGDWEALLELCLLAFAAGCESLEVLVGHAFDWRTCLGRYLRSLTRSHDKKRLFVADVRGSLVGFVHYEVDRRAQCGRIGVSAVHPARQGEGIGPLMYNHALEAMRAQGLRYATADTGSDVAHSRARRAYEKVGFVGVPTVHYFMKLGGSGASVPRAGGGRRRRAVVSGGRTRRVG